MPYAERTDVPVERSKAEIERILMRYGATEFVQGTGPLQAMVGFKAKDRYVRIRLALPDPKRYTEAALAQGRRQKWRALALVIKAKLESVASGIETFEEAFLPHVVMPDGKTLAEHVSPMIAQAYRTGRLPALLPGFGETGA